MALNIDELKRSRVIARKQNMRKPRVIIYDDDVNILNLLKDFFSRIDYEVLTYSEPIVCPIREKNADNCIDHNPCADIILTDLSGVPPV
jgi:DNA-binding response OmpR family regulator